jgi:SAM-dependent methyltransferase
MALKYKSVVPWGRSFQEYTDMFALTEDDLNIRILGCGDGPAAFNSAMKQRGRRVVSVDPIYEFSAEEIEQRIKETYNDVISQTRSNRDKFIWTKIRDVDELGRIRMDSMKIFLRDYEEGRKEGRYVPGELPVLPFEDNSFDLALSSHFLFLYTDNLSYEFHVQSITEILRVAKEIRIFPLLDVNAARSSYADRVSEEFSAKGYSVSEKKVDYEFQKGGNAMMKIVGNN